MVAELLKLKELSEAEWMNGNFLFKNAWLRLIDHEFIKEWIFKFFI